MSNEKPNQSALPPEAVEDREGTDAPQSSEVEQTVLEVVGELLPNLDDQQRQLVADRLSERMLHLAYRSERFSGPLPHPQHLREYEDICPGAADRVLNMAEKSQNHLSELQSSHLTLEYNDRRRGMWIGALLFAALIGSSLALGLQGHSTLAGMFLGAAALGVVGLFVNGRRDDKPSS